MSVIPGSPPARTAHLRQGLALSGRLPDDLAAFLRHHGLPGTLTHSLRVAQTAADLAPRFEIDLRLAQVAGWLHDCSAAIPTPARLATALDWGLDVLPEEAANPLILHQKLSVVIAQEIFAVRYPAVLSAVGCHTTLKAGASPLDMLVFVADKLAWDQPGAPPYLPALQHALERSLPAAALVYINHLVERRAALSGPLHPWLLQAQADLLQYR